MGFEFLLRALESVNESVNWNTKWKWELRDRLWRLTTLKDSIHAYPIYPLLHIQGDIIKTSANTYSQRN